MSYIVRSVDQLLKRDFDLADGLADTTMLKAPSSDGNYSLATHTLQILDPATGTGTFLYYIINHIYESFKDNRGMWSSYVSQHLLPRLFGFELLMAPYAVAHLKLGLQLAETGYDFKDNERLGVYLTNTLEEGFEGSRLPFVEWLVEEATAAGNIKHDFPVMVVLGNPPYSGHSANKGQWITKLIETYKEGCPELKKPAQAKWLSDDYVKFIRFAQWRIERTGYGILAFITNHSYLDNPTFRGMRQSLLRSFDAIYILDLHGNSKKKELTPAGTKDENVFDIQQGVAIGLFVRRRGALAPPRLATVHHANLWGLRGVYELSEQRQALQLMTDGKYHWLAEYNVTNTPWETLDPQTPFFLLTTQNTQHLAEYEAGWKIPDIFRPNGDPAPGIVTTQDEFAISWTKAEAIKKVEQLLATESEDEARRLFRLCAQDQWQYSWAKYAQFLKIDFPRLPLISSADLFCELCTLGERLVGLHLMERFGLATPKYPVDGNNTIEKVEYLEPHNQLEQGRVYINKTQYFNGISPEVWEFHIGGYQVCEKWLKDRKGRRLSFDDIQHYQRIVAALAETNTLMEKIDETIDEHGGWPIE